MRTVSQLLNLGDRVYVYLDGKNICRLFLQNAEAEGFTFGDGEKPTHREGDDIFALKRDWTIAYVGWVGHVFFRCPRENGGPVRVDYGKYLSGAADYLM